MKKMMMSVMVMIMTSSMTVMGNTVTKSDKHNDGHKDNKMEVTVGNHNTTTGWSNRSENGMRNGMNDNMDKGGKTYDMGKGMNDKGKKDNGGRKDNGKKDKGHDYGMNDMHKGVPEPMPKPEPVHHVDDVTTGVVVGTVIVGTLLSLLN